jgi:AcrR family transcriptional regulator
VIVARSSQPSGHTRPRSPRGHGDDLRADILAAAGELLAETGDQDAVSIRAVADRVGVSAPSIYLHFPDKETLLTAVCVEAFTELDVRLAAATERVDDCVEAIAAQGRTYVEFALERPEHYRLMLMRRPGRELDAPTEAELTAVAGLGRVIERISAAQAAGRLPPDEDPARVALVLWSAVHGIASLLIAKPHFPWGDREDLFRRVLQMCLHDFD